MKYLSLFAFLLLALPSFSNDTLQTESGLRYYYVHYGNGEAVKDGWVVIAHYDGRFLDGTPFDSSRERGQPFAFNYNRGQVIKGMENVDKITPGEPPANPDKIRKAYLLSDKS